MPDKMSLRPEISWGTVSTVFEYPDLTVFFAAYHLAAGAKEVHVYLDNPEDPAFERLSNLPGCVPVRCDGAHWARLTRGVRPQAHTRRQSVNANHCYRRCNIDWLIHIDADEFLHQIGDLAAELAELPADVHCVRYPVVERVFLPGDRRDRIIGGHYRVPIDARPQKTSVLPRPRVPLHLQLLSPSWILNGKKRKLMERMLDYLTERPELLNQWGFTGHTGGKVAVRVGHPYTMSIHHARHGLDQDAPQLPKALSQSTVLLHNEGATPLAWALKRVRKRMRLGTLEEGTPDRTWRTQVNTLWDDGNPDRALALYEELSVLNPLREQRMRAANLILDIVLDEAGVDAFLKECPPLDLTTVGFDGWLWGVHGKALRELGFVRSH